MQKVEADHNQTESQADISDESLTIPQERQKRPYYRHNITNIAENNPSQETTISDQSPTAEIAIRTKRPYHRHPKTDTPIILHDDFLENYSLDKLRELAVKRKFSGRQNRTVEKNISAVSQDYFDSESYKQSSNSFFSAISSIESDKPKLERSYKLGLIRTLRVFYSITDKLDDSKKEQALPQVIKEFELHCQNVAQKFTTNKRYRQLRPTLHVLIQYPDLHHVEIVDQVMSQISDNNSFLNYFSINQLFKGKYDDASLKEVITKKTEIFEKLKDYNQEHQLGASISELRIAAVFYTNPFAFLEKTAEKNRLKKRRNKSPEQPQVAEKKVRRHRLKTEHPPENTGLIEQKKRGRKRQTEIQKTNKLLSGLLNEIKQRPISPEDRETLFKTVESLYQYLQPITVREGRLVIETDQNRERIIQGYLNQGHEFLTRETIEYYLNRYHAYDTEINDGVRLFDTLSQKYKDRNILGLKQIIVESVKRRRQDAHISIDKYIAIVSGENFSTKYGSIPASKVYTIVSKYIYEKNVDLSAMYGELKREALQW